LRNAVPKAGLAAKFRDRTVGDIAREAVRISRAGLAARRRINALSQDETVYLAPLESICATGNSVADELLARYDGPWKRKIDHIFAEFAF
jgi:glutamate--cysteine ligase